MHYLIKTSEYPWQCENLRQDYLAWVENSIYTFTKFHTEPNLDAFIIRKTAKLTDLIDGGPFGLNKGLLITNKLLGILQSSNIPDDLINVTDAYVYQKDKRIRYNGVYYAGLFTKTYVEDYIDLPGCIFEYRFNIHIDNRGDYVFEKKMIKFETLRELKIFKERSAMGMTDALKPFQIILKRDDFDFIVLPEIEIFPIISEKFRQTLLENKITGIDFEPLDGKSYYGRISHPFIFGKREQMNSLLIEKEKHDKEENEKKKLIPVHVTPQEEWNDKVQSYHSQMSEYYHTLDQAGTAIFPAIPYPDHKINQDLASMVYFRIKEGNGSEYSICLPPMYSVFEYPRFCIRHLFQLGDQLILSTPKCVIALSGKDISKHYRNSKWIDSDLKNKIYYNLQKNKLSIFDYNTSKEIDTIELPDAEYNSKRDKIAPLSILAIGNLDILIMVSMDGIYACDRQGGYKLLFPDSAVLSEIAEDFEEEDKEIDLLSDAAGEISVHVSVSPDYKKVLIGSTSGSFLIYDSNLNLVDTIEFLDSASYPDNLRSIFSLDGKHVFLCGGNPGNYSAGIQKMDDLESDPIMIHGNFKVKSGFAFMDGFIIGDGDGCIQALDMNGHRLWREYIGAQISSIYFQESEKQLIVGTYLGTIHFYDLQLSGDFLKDLKLELKRLGIIRSAKEIIWWK
jgi:hypothetical protein